MILTAAICTQVQNLGQQRHAWEIDQAFKLLIMHRNKENTRQSGIGQHCGNSQRPDAFYLNHITNIDVVFTGVIRMDFEIAIGMGAGDFRDPALSWFRYATVQ